MAGVSEGTSFHSVSELKVTLIIASKVNSPHIIRPWPEIRIAKSHRLLPAASRRIRKCKDKPDSL